MTNFSDRISFQTIAGTLCCMSLFTIETYRELKPHDEQEWLLTNGLGGFSSSTVLGMNTRRYHGLLCAATMPPVGRVMTINRMGEILTVDNKPDQWLEFSINSFRGQLHPRGDKYLTQFDLGDTAIWKYDIEGVKVTKELQIVWMKNVAAVRYTVDAGSRPFTLSLLPFATLRDFHGLRQAGASSFWCESADRKVTLGEGAIVATVTSDAGKFIADSNWWYGHVYPVDTERGQGDIEDQFTPGRFVLEGTGKATITLWIGLNDVTIGDWDGEIRRRQSAVVAACSDPENKKAPSPHPVCSSKSKVIQQLFRASNDFVVYRKAPDGKDGTSVVAGYPWFADWGRDTMISLPGLLLATGRFHQAREVLTVFAQYVSDG